MVTRRYRCAACGEVEHTAPISSPVLAACASCGAPLRQVYHAPSLLVRGTPGSATRLRRPFVGREADGRETVYTSLEQAQRGELDKAAGAFGGTLPAWAQRRVAAQNVRHLRKYAGLVPGTVAAAQCAAAEEKAGGD